MDESSWVDTFGIFSWMSRSFSSLWSRGLWQDSNLCPSSPLSELGVMPCMHRPPTHRRSHRDPGLPYGSRRDPGEASWWCAAGSGRVRAFLQRPRQRWDSKSFPCLATCHYTWQLGWNGASLRGTPLHGQCLVPLCCQRRQPKRSLLFQSHSPIWQSLRHWNGSSSWLHGYDLAQTSSLFPQIVSLGHNDHGRLYHSLSCWKNMPGRINHVVNRLMGDTPW